MSTHPTNNFDLIRLVAASQVMVLHIVHNLGVDLGPAWTPVEAFLGLFPGVPIFFVISGYLVSASLERSRSLASYARNRFLRIYPALLACTAITLLFAVLAAGPALMRVENAWPLAKWLIAQLTIFQFYVPASLKSAYGLGHWNGSLWTLPVEIQFYALLPLIYVALRRWPAGSGWILGGLFLASYLGSLTLGWGSRLQGGPWEGSFLLWRTSVLPHLYMFLLGVLAQRARAMLGPWLEGRAVHWLIAYLAACWLSREIAGVTPGGNAPNPVLMVLLAGLTLSAAVTAPSLSQRIFRGNDISYGTYIYYMVVANLLYELGLRGSVTSAAIAIVASYLLAWLSWRWIEAPALRWKSLSLPWLPRHAR